MKAITVQQPWAWAIIHGGKDIENRTRIGTWRPAIGQRVAVHAGKGWSFRGQISKLIWAALEKVGWPIGPLALRDDPRRLLARGAIIGSVLVEDVHPDAGCCQPWGERNYIEAGGTKRTDIVHLVLADPRPADPVECRGALGLWTVPDDVAAQLA